MKTVEVLESEYRFCPESSNLKAALREAIAWAKVGEFMDYRHSLSRSSLGWFLTDLKDGTVIIANSITELAAKLEKLQ